MFSVVIPLYNKESSIAKTIQSILDQTFIDFEIIVVNDGSTDNSLQVVELIVDSRIRIINKSNGGVSSARNRGIKEAKNEWVTFLDGDDLWERNHLKEYSYVLNKHPDLVWVISGYISKKDNKIWRFVYTKNGILNNIFDDLLKGLKIHTSTICLKRSTFDFYPDMYFTEGLNNSEDREVWYKLCCINQSPYYINKSLSIYTHDDENSLTKNSGRKLNDSFLSLEARLEMFTGFRLLKDEDKRKIKQYLNSFNRKVIIGAYIRTGILENEYKGYFAASEWVLLNVSKRWPLIVRKIISKIL